MTKKIQKPKSKKISVLETKVTAKDVVASGKSSKPHGTKPAVKAATKSAFKTEPSSPLKSSKNTHKAIKPSSSKKTKAKKEESEMDEFLLNEESSADEIGEYAAELEAVDESEESEADDVNWELDAEKETPAETEFFLTDADGRRYCRGRDCGQVATVDSYCRYHYLLLWKNIQIRRKILADGKLEKYVIDLTSRYPDKFLEIIRKDLKTEKDFVSAIQELEIDESANENSYDDDDSQTYIDEVRGLTESSNLDEEEF